MKIILNNKRQGIAMTEYLIILAIVAVAAILVVGLFGKQIKNTFNTSTAAMGGASSNNSAQTTAATTDNMGSFGKNAAN